VEGKQMLVRVMLMHASCDHALKFHVELRQGGVGEGQLIIDYVYTKGEDNRTCPSATRPVETSRLLQRSTFCRIGTK
jgi:hypothetical protein